MVKVKILLILLVAPLSMLAQESQTLTLTQAYAAAMQHYPLIRETALIKETADLSIDNLRKGFLPQFSLSGQASYQSETTSLPVSLPGLNIESPAKDQYKVVADLNQLIYDGGLTREQKAVQQLSANVENKKLDVELYQVKQRINQLFLGIVFLDAQLQQVELVKADIQNGINRVSAQVNNGVAFKSSLNMLKAEYLKADQRSIEINASRTGLLDALSLFMGQQLAPGIKLEVSALSTEPSVQTLGSVDISRPEIGLYDEQNKLIDQQRRLINARNLPKASLFAQGGYGRPGLNFLKNEFDFYYVGGLRFNWSFGGLYTQKKEKRILELNKKSVELRKETFLLSTNADLKQSAAEITKLSKLISSDQEIILLRASVKEAAKAQLENGVITANDYLKEINAEDQARQSLTTHEVQLLQAKINYQTISGK